MNASFWAWCHSQRRSSRLGFILQTGSRVVTALLALWWMRALSKAMGDDLYGMFVTFQGIASLGGLGDLGVGAVVGLRVGQHLGRGAVGHLNQFLALARGLFLSLSLVALFAGLILSPWLPDWLKLTETQSSGSLTLLCCLGVVNAALLIFGSYIQNVNYAAGNVTWPIVPVLICTQLAALVHWALALSGAAVALQFLPYVVNSALMIVVVWAFVRMTDPNLSSFRPIKFDWREWRPLLRESFWAYLWSLGFMVFAVTDRALINGSFGGAEVTRYHFSAKFVELAVMFLATACSVSMPKLTQWLASGNKTNHARAHEAILRLNGFQTFMGCAGALVYLGAINLFVAYWFGPAYVVPLPWQFALAWTMVINAGASAAVHISSRCGTNAMRYSGILVGISALINLALSLVAAWFGTIAGIIFATVVAQTFLSVAIGRYVCQHFGMSFPAWLARNWVLPSALISIAYVTLLLKPDGLAGIILYIVVAGVLVLLAGRLTQMNWAFIRSEIQSARSMLRGSPADPTPEKKPND